MDNNTWIILLIAAAFIFIYACKPSKKVELPVNPYLVDVRTAKEFNAGSVVGAINIPLDQVKTRISELKGKENLVLFCRSGNRSGQAKTILEQNGFTGITNGGGWKSLKKQLEQK